MLLEACAGGVKMCKMCGLVEGKKKLAHEGIKSPLGIGLVLQKRPETVEAIELCALPQTQSSDVLRLKILSCKKTVHCAQNGKRLKLFFTANSPCAFPATGTAHLGHQYQLSRTIGPGFMGAHRSHGEIEHRYAKPVGEMHRAGIRADAKGQA